MKKLSISDQLSLPVDAATQTFAFIGRKGSGKTYGSGKLTELLIDSGIQVAILDTVGNWYGLRLAANGKDKGIDIPIVGGLRGDIPLEPTGGALIADVLIDSGRSMIIDASQFTKADRQRFATAFGERLWKRKKAEHDPTPIQLIMEESQLIVPENVRGDSAAMVGIYEEIIRLGRNYGIGVTMITQRPQSVNKEVLNQTECLMVFQVNGAHERKALRDWIVHQGMDPQILNELPSLKPGECYVWSPQWLSILKKIKIGKKRTFDSTSTPKAGGTFRGKALAAIDMADLQTKMQATIDKAKSDDPRELKKKIAELEKLLAQKPIAPAKEKIKELPVITKAQFEKFEKTYNKIISEAERHGKAMAMFWETQHEEAVAMLEAVKSVNKGLNGKAAPIESVQVERPVKKQQVQKSEGVDLGKCAKTILKVLAQRSDVDTDKNQLAALSGYSVNSGGFKNSLSSLRQGGLIGGFGPIRITELGYQTIGDDYEPLPTGPALQDYWYAKLGKAESTILHALIEGGVMDKNTISERTGYSINSGGFKNALSRLRTLKLIEGFSEIKPADIFFE
jgi:hypothetical protein